MSPLRPVQSSPPPFSPTDQAEPFQTARPSKRQRNGRAVFPPGGQTASLVRATRPSLREELSALAVDAVTLSALRDPYLLGACGHSFDAKTIEALVRKDGAACPLCRTPVLAPSSPNYLARELLDVLQRYGLSESAGPLVQHSGPIAPPRPPQGRVEVANDLGAQFCCAGVTWVGVTLCLGLSHGEPIQSVCAFAACAAGVVGLAAGYILVVWFPVRGRGLRERTPA